MIINFLRAGQAQMEKDLERDGGIDTQREREEIKKEQLQEREEGEELKAECPRGIQAVPNPKKRASVSLLPSLSLQSFLYSFILFPLLGGNCYTTSEEAAINTSKRRRQIAAQRTPSLAASGH